MRKRPSDNDVAEGRKKDFINRGAAAGRALPANGFGRSRSVAFETQTRPLELRALALGLVMRHLFFVQGHSATDVLGKSARAHGRLGPKANHQFVAQRRRVFAECDPALQLLASGSQKPIGAFAPSR